MSDLNLIGVEDGSFDAFTKENNKKTILSAIQTYNYNIVAVELRYIIVDGTDATEKLLDMLTELHFEVLLLGGITFAGFNVIDIAKIYDETRKPIIVFIKEKPNMASVKDALIKHFPDWRHRWKAIENLGEIFDGITKEGCPPIYYESVGINPGRALNVLRKSSRLSKIPEQIRLAGLIAKAVSKAE